MLAGCVSVPPPRDYQAEERATEERAINGYLRAHRMNHGCDTEPAVGYAAAAASGGSAHVPLEHYSASADPAVTAIAGAVVLASLIARTVVESRRGPEPGTRSTGIAPARYTAIRCVGGRSYRAVRVSEAWQFVRSDGVVHACRTVGCCEDPPPELLEWCL
jgi:hypothetical protein